MLDVGCGDGFHLPLFTDAASVTGVEPYAPLVARARTRLADRPGIRVLQAGAAALPLPDASVDLVHARTAYFFGPRLRAGPRRGAAGPAAGRGDRDRRPRRHRAPLRRVDARRPPALRPRRRGGVLRRARVLAAPDPDGLALPGPGDPRRRAAHRVQPRCRRARDRGRGRAGDPGRLPAARAPCRLSHAPDRPGLGRAGPPAAHRARAGTVGGPVGGDGTVRAQASRGSGFRGAGPRGRRRLAGGLGGPAQRNGDGGPRPRPRGHRVADRAGDPVRRAPVAGRGWTTTGDGG